MTGYHTRWARLEEIADDPERIAIREALAFGKALHDIRTAGWTESKSIGAEWWRRYQELGCE